MARTMDNESEFCRRDWFRTNDPYRVKVGRRLGSLGNPRDLAAPGAVCGTRSGLRHHRSMAMTMATKSNAPHGGEEEKGEMKSGDVVIIEDVGDDGTRWLVSANGPDPEGEDVARAHGREDALKFARLLKDALTRAEKAEAQLDAIDDINEEDWESGEAASWVHKIRNGEPLDGMVTQDAYEESFCTDVSEADRRTGFNGA